MVAANWDEADQGLLVVITSNIYSHQHDLVKRYIISVSQMTTDMFDLSYSQFGPFRIHGIALDFDKRNTTDATST